MAVGAAAVPILGFRIFDFVARLAFLATRFVLRDAAFAAVLRRADVFFFGAFFDFFMDLFALRAILRFPLISCARPSCSVLQRLDLSNVPRNGARCEMKHRDHRNADDQSETRQKNRAMHVTVADNE